MSFFVVGGGRGSIISWWSDIFQIRRFWNGFFFFFEAPNIHNHRLKGFQEKTILPFMRVVKDFMQISVKEYSCIRRRVVTSLECIWSIHINPSPSSSILFARETSGKLWVCILSKSIQPELLSHCPLPFGTDSINIMMTSCRRDQPYKSSTSLKALEGNGIADVVNLFANLFWGLGWAPA